jgi:hypothetical protein
MNQNVFGRTGLFLSGLLLFIGCAAVKQTPTITKSTFTFDYTPKTTNKSGSSSMVLACISPSYAKGFSSGSAELFKNFRSALGNDLEELIIGKGFTMKGPYLAFDEMIFEDKKRTDVAIMIEIAPSFTAAEGGWKENVSLLGSAYSSYSYSGKASLVGKINLTGIEPLTNEKIWSKSVLIPNVENIPIATSNKYKQIVGSDVLFEDPGIYNAIGKALQEQYEGILSKIEAHFNPEEFNSLKSQIKELKSKKGF